MGLIYARHKGEYCNVNAMNQNGQQGPGTGIGDQVQ